MILPQDPCACKESDPCAGKESGLMTDLRVYGNLSFGQNGICHNINVEQHQRMTGYLSGLKVMRPVQLLFCCVYLLLKWLRRFEKSTTSLSIEPSKSLL